MTTIRKIVTSKVDGNSANNTTADEIRPFGETAFYVDTDGDTNKLVLSIHDGERTHLKSKVVGPGVLYGSNADSGDGNNYDTIKLIPDAELQYNDGTYNNDQYLIVDPTAPNHIHLRAGGTIDNSNAALILGGENSNVEIQAGENPPVYVRANNNTWMFDVDGSLTFPDASTQTTAWTGSVDWDNVTNTPEISSADTGNITFNNNEIQGNLLNTIGTQITVNQNRIGGTSQNSNVFELTKSADTDQVQVGWVIRGSSGSSTAQTITQVFDSGSYWQFFVASGIQTEFPITIESPDYEIGTDPELILTVNPNGIAPKSWTLGEDGSITFPDDTVQTTAYTGSIDIASRIEYTNFDTDVEHIAELTDNDFRIRLNTHLLDEEQITWAFGTDGAVTFPAGGTITETVITDNPTIVIEPFGAESPDQGLYIKGGVAPQDPVDYHLHLTTGDLTDTSIIVGTDEHNVRTTVDGGVELNSYNYGTGTQRTLTFSSDGLLAAAPGTPLQILSTGSGGSVGMGWTSGISEESENLALVIANSPGSVGGAVEIVTGPSDAANAWVFDSSGALTVPGDIQSENDISIRINLSDSTQRVWRFGEDGDLTFPNGTTQATAYTGTGDITFTNNIISGPDQENSVILNPPAGRSVYIGSGQWTGSNYDGIKITRESTESYISAERSQYLSNKLNLESTNEIKLTNKVPSGTKTWLFKENGNLQIPGDITFPDSTIQTTAWTGSVDWDDVTNTPTIGSADTGNITFDDNTIQGNPLGTVGTQITVNSNYLGVTSQNSNVFNLSKSADTDQVLVGWIIRGTGGSPQTITNKIDGGSYWQFFVASGIQTEFPITIQSPDYQLGSNAQLVLTVDPGDSSSKSWTFDADGDLSLPGRLLLNSGGVQETFQSKADATGVVDHDCSLGHIFFHTSPTANWTANFTNLDLAVGASTNLVLVIGQGATPYYPSAVAAGGSAQTIKWLGNVVPTPTANKTEIATFSIFNNSGTYIVLGSYSTYG